MACPLRGGPHRHGGHLRLLYRRRRLHPGKLRPHGHLCHRLYPVLLAGPAGHAHLPSHRLPRGLLHLPGGPPVPAGGHDARHAPHVDELPPAYLLLDVHPGEHRPLEPAFPVHRPHRPGQPHFRYQLRLLPHDQHPGRGSAGHGLQLPALHDPPHLLGHREDGRQPPGGRPGPGSQRRGGLPQGDPAPEPPRGPLRGDHGVRSGGVHLRHLPPAGRRHPDDVGRPH